MVVGGHTHSFLHTPKGEVGGATISPETVRGPYPTIVKNIGKQMWSYMLILKGLELKFPQAPFYT